MFEIKNIVDEVKVCNSDYSCIILVMELICVIVFIVIVLGVDVDSYVYCSVIVYNENE